MTEPAEDASQNPAGNPSSEQTSTGLGVIFLTVFMDLVGFSIIFPLFPAMLEHYLGREGPDGALGSLVATLNQLAGAAGAQAELYTTVLFGGLLGSLYAVLQFFASPFWGQLSDRLGRRRVLTFTVAGTALCYVLWFFAEPFGLLVLSRLVGGLMSGNISVATAAIADVTTKENRAKGMGALGAAFGLGFIIGPAIGGGLAQIDLTTTLSFVPGINPFSAPALGAFILAAINFVWIALRFKETLSDENRLHAESHRRPLNPLGAIAQIDDADVRRINVLFFIFTFAFTGMEFTLTFLARDRFDYTPMQNAILFIYVGFIIAFVQGGVVRRLAPRMGEKRLTIVGFALVIPGLVATGLAQTQVVLYAGLGVLSFGSALANPSLTALVSLYTDAKSQGFVLGVFRSLGSLARASGPLVAATTYWKLGARWPYLGAAILIVVPLVMALGLPTPTRED